MRGVATLVSWGLSKLEGFYLVFRLSLVGVLVVGPELVLLGSCCKPKYII